MKKEAFIINPAAHSGATGRKLPEIKRLVRNIFSSADIFVTERPLHACEIAEQCLREGYGLIVAVGGDGTINETLNGFMAGTEQNRSNAAFAFICEGTGGDLQRSFSLEKGLERNLLRIREGKEKIVDIGKVSATFAEGQKSRYFLNIASCGLSAEVAQRVNNSPKNINGKIAYYWATLRTILTHKSWPLEVTIEGERSQYAQASLLVLANGRYFGGGMFIAPHAMIDDGLFDQVLVSKMNLAFFVKNGWRVYKGSHLKHPQVLSQKCARLTAKSTSKQLIGIEVEGELFGSLPAIFEILPKALKIII